MGKKAFLERRRPARSSLARLPARVLSAAGLAAASPEIVPLRNGASPARRGLAPVVPLDRFTSLASGSIVLGVDPGTILVGYGVVEMTVLGPRFREAGVVRPDRRAQAPVRLGTIQRQITLLIERIRPAIVVVERAFAARNVQSALRIGEGRGVILACAASFGAEIVEMTPASAKRAVVGNGAADKIQVARMAAAALGLREPPRPLDASDALALALAHVWTRFDCRPDGRSSRQR